MGFLIFLLSVGLIVLDVYIAKEFSLIAELKGYHTESRKYFWWCVFLGLFAYLMVIALPDRSQSRALSNDLPEL